MDKFYDIHKKVLRGSGFGQETAYEVISFVSTESYRPEHIHASISWFDSHLIQSAQPVF